MNKLVALMIVGLLLGCAGGPEDDRYIDYGQVVGERVRIPPCNPFLGGAELLDWSTALDTSASHDRSAKVAVDADGRVRCSSKESGRSTYVR